MSTRTHSEAYDSLINTTRWQKLRRAYLSKHPLCEDCMQRGRVTAATEVHHIEPIEWAQGIEAMRKRAYDQGNLRALCHECHVNAHKEMGRGGRKRLDRLRQQQREAFSKRFE